MEANKEWMGLQSALEQLGKCYEAFQDASHRQRRALIEHDIEGLTVILNEMEIIADEIFLLDSRRRMHMEILSEKKGDHEILNLKELATLWPDFDFAPLSNAAERLRGLRAEIEKQTRVNTALINSSRQLVQATVEAIVRPPVNDDNKANKTYGADGSCHQEKAPVRNLINRKG